MKKTLTIAIDGPAGSGKSTTAKRVAARLGLRYLDTGAMYRALSWVALMNRVSPADEATLCEMADKLTIEFKTERELNRVYVDGAEVTGEIRSPEVTKVVSEVSAHRSVRESMVAKQKEIGKSGGIVAEGRDTTTVVFPHADIKVFLIASVEARASRRSFELLQSGVVSTAEEQKADIERRDAYDSGRAHSPLFQAPDAIVLDTTNLTIDQQVDYIVALAENLMLRG